MCLLPAAPAGAAQGYLNVQRASVFRADRQTYLRAVGRGAGLARERRRHLSELSAANGQLRAAIAQLGVAAQNNASLRELRSEVIESLRLDAESRSRSLMGPRADG